VLREGSDGEGRRVVETASVSLGRGVYWYSYASEPARGPVVLGPFPLGGR
jgi:hypothetical protein